MLKIIHATSDFVDRERLGGCPFCSGKRLHNTNSLATKFPHIAKQWHPTKNGDFTPDMVRYGSHKVVWWQCELSKAHVYQAPVKARTAKGRGPGCPFCAGKQVTPEKSLATKAPAVAAEWHPTLNGTMTPDMVTYASRRDAWWQCPKVKEHAWLAPIHQRTLTWRDCSLCAESADKAVSLEALFPELSAQFDLEANHPLRPSEVKAKSSKKVWWRCSKNDQHKWSAAVYNRTIGGSGCPDCYNNRRSGKSISH